MFGAPIPQPYEHQRATTDFILEKRQVFLASDPGTGKTRSVLEALRAWRQEPSAGKALILAPKSILEAAWGADCKRFTPELSYSVAYAHNRAKAFRRDADIYLTNHDAATWLVKNLSLLREANIRAVIVDESTAFKHHTSARSKALRKLIEALNPQIRIMMTGTPNTNDPLHIWHQILLIDDGERLGRSYFKFRQALCTPIPIGRTNHFNWEPKPEANEVIADIIDDITIRYRFEDCIDIPPNVERVIPYQLTPTVRDAYETLRKDAILELETGTVTAINAAVLHNKLMQASAGAVYYESDQAHYLDQDRYELIRELIEQRQQCVIAFWWAHQRNQLKHTLNSAKIPYAVIDGSVNDADRLHAAERFNTGDIRVILAHPQSAAHGLTLTAGTTTIWPSPIANAELYLQFNRRIYRAGQTKKTETLVVIADDTLEQATHLRCTNRVAAQQSILDMLKETL